MKARLSAALQLFTSRICSVGHNTTHMLEHVLIFSVILCVILSNFYPYYVNQQPELITPEYVAGKC